MSERDAYDVAVGLLARREHSRGELCQKLAERGFDDQAQQTALEALGEAGLQCDQRFVESFIRSRIARGQGPVRIRAELGRRGVDGHLIGQGLLDAESEHDWSELAAQALEKRWPQVPTEAREKAKAMRFLAQRGFPQDVVYRLFD